MKRKLETYETEAWDEYVRIVDDYHITHRVKSYDRVSIHENFPEIKAAFEHCLAMKTFAALSHKYEVISVSANGCNQWHTEFATFAEADTYRNTNNKFGNLHIKMPNGAYWPEDYR
jgi:hypothetical protein